METKKNVETKKFNGIMLQKDGIEISKSKNTDTILFASNIAKIELTGELYNSGSAERSQKRYYLEIYTYSKDYYKYFFDSCEPYEHKEDEIWDNFIQLCDNLGIVCI